MNEPRVIKAFPPNYVELKRMFPCGPETIFAWANVIYRPNGRPLSKPILLHETTHCTRQLEMGVEEWWRKYIDASAFRFEEELVAHRVEWRAFLNGVPMPGAAASRRMLEFIAGRLAGPLYGGLISIARAKSMIQ